MICNLLVTFFHALYQPSGHPSQQQVAPSAVSPSTTTDPKRPFGGLVPSQPKGTRAYQDAASYNQHLAQHQAYTAQAQAASQAANNVFRNPYIATQLQSQPSSSSTYPASATDSGNAYSQPPQPQHSQYAASSQSQRGLSGARSIHTHMPFHRAEQHWRGATAVL
jgi:dual specificity protein kinase YAK1